MQVIDVEKQASTARATEFSEQCELVCFAPMGETAGDWGNELIAGAVHGSESPLPIPPSSCEVSHRSLCLREVSTRTEGESKGSSLLCCLYFAPRSRM